MTQQDTPPLSTNAPRIVAATDGSPAGERAVRRAAALAQAQGAALDIVRVHDRGGTGAAWRTLQGWFAASGLDENGLIQADRDALSGFARELTKEHAGLDVRAVWLDGPVAQTIAAHAAAQGAYLVVAGAHGSHRLRDMLLGSTADRLMRLVATDLLLVRGDAAQPYRCVLLPVDLEPLSGASALRAQRLAPQARAVLLHVYELPYEAQLDRAGVDPQGLAAAHARVRAELAQALNDLAQASGLQTAQRLVEHGRAAVRILDVAQTVGADLVALRASAKSSLQHLTLGSVTQHLAHEARCDLLLVRAPANAETPG